MRDGDRSFVPVERPVALAERVYHALRERLRSGAIGPGQPLQEVQLAEALGVSRTPVREAMARLATEGLLASDRRSFTVPALTRQDVDDIYEVRYLVEPAALKRVAPLTVDARRRARIDAALAAAVAAHRAGNADAFRQAHIDYRNAWLALVPNTRLVRGVEQYADHHSSEVQATLNIQLPCFTNVEYRLSLQAPIWLCGSCEIQTVHCNKL